MNNRALSIIERLREAQRSRSLCLFIGAGVSKNSKCPLWCEVTQALISEMERAGDKVPGKANDSEIASLYTAMFGKQQLFKRVRGLFPKEWVPHHIHHLLLDLQPAKIITTNYDNLIEEALRTEKKYFDVINSEDSLAKKKGHLPIIKMHGDFDSGSIDIKEYDLLGYETDKQLLFGAVIQSFVENLVIMFGYSLVDPHVKQLVQKVHRFSGGKTRGVIVISVDDVCTDTQKLSLEEIGVNLIHYKDFLGENDDPDLGDFGMRLEKVLNALILKMNAEDSEAEVEKWMQNRVESIPEIASWTPASLAEYLTCYGVQVSDLWYELIVSPSNAAADFINCINNGTGDDSVKKILQYSNVSKVASYKAPSEESNSNVPPVELIVHDDGFDKIFCGFWQEMVAGDYLNLDFCLSSVKRRLHGYGAKVHLAFAWLCMQVGQVDHAFEVLMNLQNQAGSGLTSWQRMVTSYNLKVVAGTLWRNVFYYAKMDEDLLSSVRELRYLGCEDVDRVLDSSALRFGSLQLKGNAMIERSFLALKDVRIDAENLVDSIKRGGYTMHNPSLMFRAASYLQELLRFSQRNSIIWYSHPLYRGALEEYARVMINLLCIGKNLPPMLHSEIVEPTPDRYDTYAIVEGLDPTGLRKILRSHGGLGVAFDERWSGAFVNEYHHLAIFARWVPWNERIIDFSRRIQNACIIIGEADLSASESEKFLKATASILKVSRRFLKDEIVNAMLPAVCRHVSGVQRMSISYQDALISRLINLGAIEDVEVARWMIFKDTLLAIVQNLDSQLAKGQLRRSEETLRKVLSVSVDMDDKMKLTLAFNIVAPIYVVMSSNSQETIKQFLRETCRTSTPDGNVEYIYTLRANGLPEDISVQEICL